MTAFRPRLFVAAAALPFALWASPAAAQVSDEIVLNILRNCAQIDDATARLACYDNNIRAAGVEPRGSVPGSMDTPNGGRGAPLAGTSSGPSGFGREDVRTPERFESPAGELDDLRARIASISQQSRGIYLFTLEDGAQWQFVESVPFSYRPPREGSTVEIDRASLGSFLMTYDGQQSVRVRRVR